MQALYKTEVTATGGREGRVLSKDSTLDLALAIPKELGGPGGAKANPEMLFAAGYSACFEGAVRFVARQKKVAIQEAHVTAEVGIGKDEVGFKLEVKLAVALPGIDRAVAQQIVDEAQNVCPYSKATKNNIESSTRLI